MIGANANQDCPWGLQVLPRAFTDADQEAGYRYEISVLQAEFSLTQVLDQPVSGRVFFEHVIRDDLDAGRPDRISLVFHLRTFARLNPELWRRARCAGSAYEPSPQVKPVSR